jgi:PD-(D/E)XK nuclease superfamily
MKIEDFWDNVFQYDTYVKGAEFSASNFTTPMLINKLKRDNPSVVPEIATKDKTASWVGTAIHERIEASMDKYESVESEVKVLFKNISGTIDLVFNQEVIGDIKTGSEANIIKKIKDSTDWVIQLSIYRYLYFKQNKIWLDDIGKIFWYCTDSKKYGIHDIQLLPKDEVIAMMKDFLLGMTKPTTDDGKCPDCLHWRYRYCGVRSVCPYWRPSEESQVDDW